MVEILVPTMVPVFCKIDIAIDNPTNGLTIVFPH